MLTTRIEFTIDLVRRDPIVPLGFVSPNITPAL